PGTYITPAVFYTKLQGTSASDIFNLSAWPNSSWIAGLDFEVGSGRIGIRMTNCNIRIYGNNFNTPSNDGNNGIQSSGASNVVNIGGKFVHECNVIGGQKNGMPNSAGIYIKNSIFGFIGGNLIGTTPDGTGARANEVGIIVENCDSAVVIGGHIDKRSSNVISGNTTAQIVVQLGGGCQIYGNKIGPSISGDAVIAASNYGVHFKPGTSGYIGKAISGYGNTIGGAINDGIRLEGTFDVKVLANYIGLSRNAATTYPALPNGTGINILNSGAVSNQIGNGTYSGRNYICKNSAVGIYMDLANNTKIKNNFIGVGPDNAAAGNGPMAIHLINGSFSNIIEHNVIGDHTSAGVWLNGAGNGNLILNNKIGTDSSGLFSRSNNTGVLVQNSGDNTVIKGNLVSGNTTGSGIELVGNFSLATISMNVIGLNSSQTSVLANIVGVKVLGCSLVDIDTNIISGNSQDGVLIDNTTNFNVRSNRIGLSSADVPYPNLLLGVFVLNGAANGMIGGAGGEGNIISGNSQTGVLVQPTCSGIGILGNKMSNNGGIGISLGNGGGWTPLPNDLNDVDDLTSYGNNGQNYPVITSAFVCSVSSQTNLSGTINVDNPTGVYRLEFFAIVPPATADPTGFGEGDSLIGNMTIVSPGSSASWAFPFGGIFPAGTRFTATLSEDIGGGKYETSEFSAAFTLGTFSAAATVVANATCSNSADGSATVSVIGATPTAFQWYTASGTPVAGATALTATGLLPGSYFCEVTESGGCNLNSDTVTITAPAPLNFTPNVLNETCAGYADGSIELVLNSGETAPFTIDAYNSSSVPAGSNSGVMYAATSTIPGLAADVYTVLVTDVNGCDDTLILTVAAGPDLTASFTTFGSFCENSPISFSDASAGTALPASGWTWDFGDAAGSNLQNPSHTYTSSGAFTVELIVTAGTCTDTATSVINIIAGPVVNAGIDDTMCVGGTYLLDGSASDAGSYNWYVLGSGTSFSTSATTVVNPASNTSYVFEVYNGTCTNTDTMNLVVTTGTDPTFSYGATNYCASVAGPVAPSFTASAGGYFDVVGGTGVTINTTTGEIFPSASVPGTYQIYHSYTSPCFIADTVTITINPLPAVTVTPDHFICYGDTATFVGTPAGGTWSGVIGLNATSGVWITWLATTNTYHTITYTYTDATTGCTNTDTNNIWLNALPPVSITGLTAGPYCVSEGPIVATGVPGGGAFLLNGTFVSGSPYNYDPTTVGTDTVAYLYVDPVTTCVNYTQVNVVVANDPVAPILGSTPPFDYCGTSPGTVTVSNPLGTEWYTDNGLTNLIATGGTVSTASFPGGTHTLYIVNTVGANCVSAPLLFTYTNYDASLITMNEPYQTCSGEPIQLNPVLGTGLSFVQWVPDTTMNDNTVLAPFVGPSVTHTYYIIVDVPALPGCTLYDSVRVDVQPCSLENITNAFSPDGDGVNDSWIINGIGSHPQNTVTVFNRWGDKMVQIDGYDNVTKVWDGKYNGSLVAAGTYYFIVQYFDDGQQKAGWIQVNY
ncbi:MAG TPA: gliding motility-associated C-terminal domain-containing protein, partial [Flavobacteriales bacterium]|nr:gliding motility-associated C-terminal domain-containing protein [Flavobacteriales bacterium]